MDEEQIKQAAEAYALQFEDVVSQPVVQDFIAGAHSRDEEVENLQNQIEELSEQLKMNAENIQKLRNPWISVDERLPKITEEVLFYSKGYVYLGMYILSKDHGVVWLADGNYRLLQHKVTHWMPIPDQAGRVQEHAQA